VTRAAQNGSEGEITSESQNYTPSTNVIDSLPRSINKYLKLIQLKI
jgi:hypothetical protein